MITNRGFISLGFIVVLLIGLSVLGGAYSYNNYLQKQKQLTQAYSDLHTAAQDAVVQSQNALNIINAPTTSPQRSSAPMPATGTGARSQAPMKVVHDPQNLIEMEVPSSWILVKSSDVDDSFLYSDRSVPATPSIGMFITHRLDEANCEADLQSIAILATNRMTDSHQLETFIMDAEEAIEVEGDQFGQHEISIEACADGHEFHIYGVYTKSANTYQQQSDSIKDALDTFRVTAR